ncbi:hypothetical protein WMY93_026993 [Mugilogobius chulae]|uniref:C-type lectin domain-containing protein n=1 Tax=Mugilogobius chulae TaxID=88201 RepID=A0AAW0N2L5_9GOBI
MSQSPAATADHSSWCRDPRFAKRFILVQCQIEYHYVSLEMTWADAQQYCREHYTDLATLQNEDDINKLEFPNETWVWIGLFDDPASWKGAMTSDSNSWRWSSTGTTNPGGYQNWASGEPNNYGGKQLCVFIQKVYGRIKAVPYPYNSFVTMSYCRQHYHDLATIESSAENQAVTNLLSTTTTSVWIGLYRVAWRWSNGSPSTYRKWKTGEPNNDYGSELCGAQYSISSWNDVSCDTLGKFICQKGNM